MRDPSNGDAVAEVTMANAADGDHAVAAARRLPGMVDVDSLRALRRALEVRDPARSAIGGGSAARVHLELGGKAPFVVFDDADLEAAIHGAVAGSLINTGQDCTAATRGIVHRSLYPAFIEGVAELFRTVLLGDTSEEATDLGPLISFAHRDHVTGMVDRARSYARVVTGGRVPGAALEKGSYYEPTLIAGADPASEIVHDEVFGPVLAVMPFDTDGEAIRLANDTPYGLAASVWTRDVYRALRAADRCALDRAADIGLGTPRMPEASIIGVVGDPVAELWRRARHGIDDRYAGTTLARAAHEELAHEMETVEHLGFATYFLTVARVADLIRGMGVRVQARDSGVGSVLNYALRTSSVEPIENGLIWERFLSPERQTLPDIDIDVESARRRRTLYRHVVSGHPNCP